MSAWFAGWSVHPKTLFFFFLENDHIIMDDLPIFKIKWSIFMGHRFISKTDMFSQVTYPFWHSKIYLFSRPTYFFFSNFKKNFSKCSYFFKIGLFSRATYHFEIPKRISTSVHAFLQLIYFHMRPFILRFKYWSIFTGDLFLFKFHKKNSTSIHTSLHWN